MSADLANVVSFFAMFGYFAYMETISPIYARLVLREAQRRALDPEPLFAESFRGEQRAARPSGDGQVSRWLGESRLWLAGARATGHVPLLRRGTQPARDRCRARRERVQGLPDPWTGADAFEGAHERLAQRVVSAAGCRRRTVQQTVSLSPAPGAFCFGRRDGLSPAAGGDWCEAGKLWTS